MYIYFLNEVDFLNTSSGQSYFLLANENAHLTTHEPIKIRVLKVKIKLKFVANTSERRVDDGDFSFESLLRSLASLSNDDGNGNENVTQKDIFISFVLLRDCFNSFNFYKNQRNYPGTKSEGVAYKLRKKMKNSPSCVHVLHKTLNVVISRY